MNNFPDKVFRKDFPIIDAHAILGREQHLHLEADELLRHMDAHEIETAIARPSGAELAVYNRAGNDRVLHSHRRIKGLVSVNPWFGEKAIEELKRCRDAGAVGLFLHPSRQGFFPTDDIVKPILDWVRETNWPVMFHTGSYVHSDILALGIVAREYSQLNFIAGFGGFTDMWFELPGVFADVSNLHLDASMMWSDAIKHVMEKCGPSRVLFGGALPRSRYACALNTINRLDFSDQQRQALFYGNAQRLFHL